jgi:low affinity Fe/Cu permease
MIIWILLIALVVTGAAILVGTVFGRAKSKSYRNGIYVGAGICAVLLVFCMILGGIYHSEVSELQAQYNDIMLYNEVVELCDNEQVRFGHYEKIEAFNEAYDRLAVIEEDFMFGTLCPKNWSADMGKIDFYFRGVNYGGLE